MPSAAAHPRPFLLLVLLSTLLLLPAQAFLFRLPAQKAPSSHTRTLSPSSISSSPSSSSSTLLRAAADGDEEEFDAAAREKIMEKIQNHKIVLFMKGSKLFPQCGFSNTACSILNKLNVSVEWRGKIEEKQAVRMSCCMTIHFHHPTNHPPTHPPHQVEYETVDVLADERIRMEIKRVSAWPTIPQLYLQGEFIGEYVSLSRLIHPPPPPPPQNYSPTHPPIHPPTHFFYKAAPTSCWRCTKRGSCRK